LLKPTRIEQLQRAFNRIAGPDQEENEQYLVLKENLKTPAISKIAFQTSEGLVISKLEEIRYLKADGAYTHIHFTNNQRITVTKTLQEYNILEETGSFFRVNRSYILNVHCIAKISKKDGGFVVMDNGEEISATLEKRNQLYNFFRDNIF
jgi:two-component system LytT family response regulator